MPGREAGLRARAEAGYPGPECAMPEGGDRRWAQTLPVEQWTAGANAATATPPVGGGAERGDAAVPRMRGLALTERLREHGYTADEPTGERFTVRGVLGDGATA